LITGNPGGGGLA